MRKWIVLALLVMSTSVLGANNYVVHQGNTDVSVVTDGGGDSTRTSGYVGIGPTYGARTLKAKITLGNNNEGKTGMGLQDSGWIWLYSVFAGDEVLCDSAVANSLPVTLNVRIIQAIGDTLLGRYLTLKWEIYDSLGDDASTVTFPIRWEILLKE